jgi:hypothetical protein
MIEHKTCVLILSVQILPETVLILKGNERDKMNNVQWTLDLRTQFVPEGWS